LARDDLPTVAEARHSLRSSPALKTDFPPAPAQPRQVTRPVEEEGTELAIISVETLPSQAAESGSELVAPTTPDPRAEHLIPQPVGAPASASDAAASREPSGGLAAVLKQQFRAAIKAVFKRTASPQPRARRRRSGESVGAFRLAARRLLKPIIRLPVVAQSFGFLNDILPWLHLWESNETSENDIAAGAFEMGDNHTSPHP
jgi:hypothetical protein